MKPEQILVLATVNTYGLLLKNGPALYANINAYH